VLFLSTVYTGYEFSRRSRRRPTITSPWSAPIKEEFGDNYIMDLELLSVAADYNDLMNAVDISDQYRAQTTSDHRERRGAARALAWSFHLSVAVANSFLLQKLGDPSWPKVTTQAEWLQRIVDDICVQYGQTGTSRQRYRAGDEITPFPLHKRVKRTNSNCQACLGVQIGYRTRGQALRRRKRARAAAPLNEASDDALNRQVRKTSRVQTRWGCEQCNVAICNNDKCWYFYHRQILPARKVTRF
jgi:hypothetical protein